ncbi:PhnD/SsuA/transferrin family substrate-binding protein [Methylomonas lenta]|nr:PhnD/SsuA/transferrin family substrate-binding protein [Methylomonas lenta]
MGFYAHSITENASLSDIEVSLNFWAKDLIAEESQKMHLNILESRAILFDTMPEMHQALLRGELDMIIAPPLEIVREFKRDELKDGFTGMLAGNQPDNLYLVVRGDKNISGIKDLAGKRMLLPEDDELAEVFVDSLFLKQFRANYKTKLTSVQKQKKGSRILLDIYFNQADAGVIYRNAYDVMVELNPDIARTVLVLEKLPIKNKNFSYFVKGYPFSVELSKMVITAFKHSVRAKQILDVFRTPELDHCSINELDFYEEFYADYLRLKKGVKP